jgi:hypothetical protein
MLRDKSSLLHIWITNTDEETVEDVEGVYEALHSGRGWPTTNVAVRGNPKSRHRKFEGGIPRDSPNSVLGQYETVSSMDVNFNAKAIF